MDSFIIKWWVAGLNALRWISPFQIVRVVFPQAAATYAFVDGWVVAHLVAAIGAWIYLSPSSADYVAWVILGYGVFRVFELITYNLSVLFVHPLITDSFALRSFRRSVILALHNYVEVFFWYAAAYRHLAGHFGDMCGIVGTADGALYYSVVTMATVGYGDITPQDALTRWLAISHICVSIFLTLVVLARFVSLLPAPRSLDPSENDK